MTGAQLKKLRQANGLSERQLAKLLGFVDVVGNTRRGNETKPHEPRNLARKITKLENKSFVPQPIVHRINVMVAEGKLVAR